MAGVSSHVQRREPIRLLWLIDSLTVGGAEALVLPFARRASENGIALTVCARTSIAGNPLEGEIRATGVRVENLGAAKLIDFAAYRRLLHLLAGARIELLHTHLAYSAIWGALAARRTGIPLVASLHVPPEQKTSWKERIRRALMVRLLRGEASRIVLVSAALAEAWRSHGLPGDRTTVVHNGIAVEEFDLAEKRDELRRELGVGPLDPLIVSVSVLREGKGIDVLIRAAARVRDALPGARLLVVGEGPMRASWEGLAEKIGIAPALIWAGHRRDVARMIGAADLFVLPTLHDAFPTVLLEALASGVAIVASRVGGVPEIVSDQTARLVPPGDEVALAAAILEALGDRQWRRQVGEMGRARARAEFSVEAWMRRLQRVYSEALRGRKQR